VSNSSQLKENLETLREQPDKLIEIILRQAGVIEEQQKKIQDLEKQIQDLNDRNNKLGGRLEELEKAAARQAAPFRIADKHRKASPGKPGRKPGHPGAHRAIPDHIDEEIVVPLTQCPDCGQAVHKARPVVQYIEELPVVRPKVIKLITHQAGCAHCQKEIRSTHPLQVSLAEGAAGVQLGPAALGLAAELNKKHGLTMRKTCAVLKQVFGLGLSPGGLSSALERLARKLQPAYEKLRARLRDGPYVHSDETSWWVGGPGHWLWVFARKDATVYRVAQGRGRNIVLETLGQNYPGVLVSDCLSVYDEVNARQQKCYSHHLKALSKALEEAPSEYLQNLRALLKAAMALKAAALEAPEFSQRRRALEQTAQELLSQPRGGLEEKVRLRLFKQRDHLFTFLDHPEVDATNNLAERQLRPAVIARKLSCGNKTSRGACTWEILASLAATCGQRAESFAKLVGGAALLHPPR
jgi:transposase